MENKLNVQLFKKITIVFLAIIGFLTTIKLAIIYYDSNFNPYALPSFCSVNSFVDCDGVAQTTHSQFFGIPLAYWGMGLYLFVILLVFVDVLKKVKFLSFLEVFKNPMSYISALGLISFLISMVLAGISIFEIKKVCVLCVFTYLLNLFIAILATDMKVGFIENFKTSIKDFIAAIKIKKYLISFVSLAFLACCVLTYTTLSYCFTPQVKRYKAIKKYADMKTNPFKTTGNILGDPKGKLVVYVYTDYRCPSCRIYNLMIYRAAQEISGVQYIHKNLPLDMACNKNVLEPLHEGSCMLAKYSIAAEKQGKLWDINSEIFDQQPKDEDAVLKLAKSLGFDTIRLRKDANSSSVNERLNQDINKSMDLGIEGTPAIVVNGKVYIGVKPYYELKDILIKAGGIERSGK